MLRSGFFCYVWKLYALSERKFRAENGGLKNGTYTQYAHIMEVPPRGGGPWDGDHCSDTAGIESETSNHYQVGQVVAPRIGEKF